MKKSIRNIGSGYKESWPSYKILLLIALRSTAYRTSLSTRSTHDDPKPSSATYSQLLIFCNLHSSQPFIFGDSCNSLDTISLMTAICIAPGGRIAMCQNCCICNSDLLAQIRTAYDLNGIITGEIEVTLHERLVHQKLRLLLLHHRMVRQRSHLQLRRDQQDLSHAHVASLARKADRAMNLPRQGVAAGLLLVAVFMLFIVLLVCRTLYLAIKKLCKTLRIV